MMRLSLLLSVYGQRAEEFAAQRILATSILADYAADQPDVLTRLLVESDSQQFQTLFPRVEPNANAAVPLLEEFVRQTSDSTPGNSKARDASAVANALIALLRLGKENPAWTTLQDSDDRSVRSYLIHRFTFPTHRIAAGRSGVRSQINSAFSICMAMFGNGVRGLPRRTRKTRLRRISPRTISP